MKAKVSKKFVAGSGMPVLSVEYCEAQHLLKGVDAQYYTCSRDGWDFDVYHITGEDFQCLVCTGYRVPESGKLSAEQKQILKAGESKAYDVYENYYSEHGIDTKTVRDRAEILREIMLRTFRDILVSRGCIEPDGIKVRDLITQEIDIDVYDDVVEDIGVCFCGPLELTPEGRAEFADVLNFGVHLTKAGVAIVEIDGDDDLWEQRLGRAKEFFYSAAGYCAEDDYNLWFVK